MTHGSEWRLLAVEAPDVRVELDNWLGRLVSLADDTDGEGRGAKGMEIPQVFPSTQQSGAFWNALHLPLRQSQSQLMCFNAPQIIHVLINAARFYTVSTT